MILNWDNKHWFVVVIDMKKEMVYILDSLAEKFGSKDFNLRYDPVSVVVILFTLFF